MSVVLRGVSYDIAYTVNESPDPTTGTGFEFDWHFEGDKPPFECSLTSAEDDLIEQAIAEACYEGDDDYDEPR